MTGPECRGAGSERDPLRQPLTLCIAGLGLMGGSLALALRGAQASDALAAARVVGVSRTRKTLEAALAAGAIDEATTDLAEGAAVADVVVLAAPVRTILRQLPEAGRSARPGTLVIDLGSTKAAICAAMADLPAGIQPIGGHPMCGKEQAGFAAAEPGLYRGRTFVLCPLPRTAPEALAQAIALVTTVGARPMVLDPTVHDEAVAAISHLPYAAAVALVNAVAGRTAEAAGGADDYPKANLPWDLAASGFRDTTRVAASDADMMLDVLLTNRGPLTAWLRSLGRELEGLAAALDAGDEAGLAGALHQAQARRRSLG